MPPRRKDYEHVGTAREQTLKPDHHDTLVNVYAFKENYKQTITFHCASIMFLCLPYFIVYWYPQWKSVKYKQCALNRAEYVLVSNTHNQHEFVHVKTEETTLTCLKLKKLKYFYYQHTKYVYSSDHDQFIHLSKLIPPCTLDDILDNSNGLMGYERKNLLQLYGVNKIFIEIKSYWTLFVEEVFNPFYIFQGFSIILWSFDQYMFYAMCVLLLTLISVVTSLIQTRKQNIAIHDLVEGSTAHEVEVLHPNLIAGHTRITLDATQLAPGDLLIIPATGCIMTCDAVLVSGNCIVNESMLTGESVPVTKTPPHAGSELYSTSDHKRHTLFSGTHVLQARFYHDEYVIARVVRTGFDTTKGILVKSILFPTPVNMKFYSESIRFLYFLSVIAIAGMAYSTYIYIRRHVEPREIFNRTLDIVTIVVPPALPAMLNLGTVYSMRRLKKLRIFCTSPMRINICGKLKLTCFDKTGTLTHDGLELYSVIPTSDDSRFEQPVIEVQRLDVKSRLVQGMSTCHSLTRIDGTINGDPLDLILFESTQWNLEEPGANETTRYDMLTPTIVKPATVDNADKSELPYEIGIIRQFPFSSTQQCMSVICRILGDTHFTAFTKGAPEKIASICVSHTIPPGFDKHLVEFAAQGFRVIAVACKHLPADVKWKDTQKIKRDLIESDLTFLGLILLQNTLKPETTPVIAALHNANIRTVMITGDNIRTAIAVARDCGMIHILEDVIIIHLEHTQDDDEVPKITLENLETVQTTDNSIIDFDSNFHFALDGKVWSKLRKHYPHLIPLILLRGTVFARFQPDQKAQLVTHFQQLDYIVSMVGDGANDCGALKAAHVGVSLSQAEASVAAPFTSAIPDISCIIHLMMEGRCALVTSFAVFKYMALYSLIQFFSVLILYANHSILADMQFLYIDLVVTTSLTVAICQQGPGLELVAERPIGSLTSLRHLIPLLLQIFLCGAFQMAALLFLRMQWWFHPLPPGKEEVTMCWENAVVFLISSFQYSIIAAIYSKGTPHRESFFRNGAMLLTLLALTGFQVFLALYPFKFLDDFFELYYQLKHGRDQATFRYEILLFPVAHLLLALFIEKCIAERKWFKNVIHFVTCKKHPRNRYKLMMEETRFSDVFF